MLDHPGRDHAQQAQRDGALDGHEAVQSAIAATGGPACGFEDRDELSPVDRLCSHATHHSASTDRPQDLVRHWPPPLCPKCVMRCWAIAAHMASNVVV
jgi:hypothetical protein